MKNIPTAEKFLEQYLRGDRVHDDINRVVDEEEAIEAMIEFAKLHVEAALKEAAETNYPSTKSNFELVNSKILNSYPLENIN